MGAAVDIRWLRLMPLLLVVTFLALGSGAWLISSHTADLRREADRNRRALLALCALRNDLAIQLIVSREFLHDHPRGIPGIPVTVMRESIANRQRTLDAIEPYLAGECL